MKRFSVMMLLALALGFAAGGCSQTTPPSYYSSRRDLLGQPTPTNAPSKSIDERLSGSRTAPTESTNTPPHSTP
jgi:hypothetical protein